VEREERFDSFYVATRRAVLHQVFALTGDLPAAQAAVRDAYVAAWQRWRKVSRLDDPLDWVRPRAWQVAQRRHTARIWHRNKRMSAQHKAVLDALAALPLAERRVLLLVELAELELPRAARELGVTLDVARRSLVAATDRFCAALDTPPSRVREPLVTLDEQLEDTTLPRGSILRRAGRKRRDGQVLVGAAVASAVALGVGAFAYQSRPGAGDLRVVRPADTPAPTDAARTLPTARNLLDADQIRRLGDAQEWQVLRTGNNTEGTGINSACQQSRFADPDGLSAMVRTFGALGTPSRSAVQTVEVSKSATQAAQAFRTTVGWYAGCQVGRLQLLNAYRVDNIGDEAAVLMVRLWQEPVTTMSVAVARTGSVTTSTVGTTVGGTPPPAEQITQSLADAVAMLCARSGSEDCAKRPTYSVVPPPPSGEAPGLLAVADLPPVGRIERPWVGTEAVGGRANPAATVCDRASFASAGAARTRSRTYLIPGAPVPASFGLSETYGTFRSTRAAARFLSDVRARVDSCEDRNLATTVSGSHTVRRGSPQVDLSGWNLSTEISDDETVRFRVGFVRVGRTVAQVTFAPSPRDDISEANFRALLIRSGDRLRELG
jgi:DNA-directed RNA polymerase specialized sigma24 family protein